MFGSKFREVSIDGVGKSVADYMLQPGEVVLIHNRVEGVPLREDIESVNIFSNKNKKEKRKIRLEFDLGVIWGIAFIFIRDEMDVNDGDPRLYDGSLVKPLYELMWKGLKYTSKYDFKESPSFIYALVEKNDKAARDKGDHHPFNKGVLFSEVFLREFY